MRKMDEITRARLRASQANSETIARKGGNKSKDVGKVYGQKQRKITLPPTPWDNENAAVVENRSESPHSLTPKR